MERIHTLAVDVAEHGRRDVDRENVVRIGEETNTGDHADFYVEPSADARVSGGFRLVVTWRKRRITHENLAWSISASAARRFSSRA